MANDDQQSQTITTRFADDLENDFWVVPSKFSVVAKMVEDAETMFRLEISVADHRGCQGGDFDLCRCMRDAAFAQAQLARVEQLEAGLAVLVAMRATAAYRRQTAKKLDERVAYFEEHPEVLESIWD